VKQLETLLELRRGICRRRPTEARTINEVSDLVIIVRQYQAMRPPTTLANVKDGTLYIPATVSDAQLSTANFSSLLTYGHSYPTWDILSPSAPNGQGPDKSNQCKESSETSCPLTSHVR
jgi:hypothetical protein